MAAGDKSGNTMVRNLRHGPATAHAQLRLNKSRPKKKNSGSCAEICPHRRGGDDQVIACRC
jgi:hypothetical protein